MLRVAGIKYEIYLTNSLWMRKKRVRERVHENEWFEKNTRVLFAKLSRERSKKVVSSDQYTIMKMVLMKSKNFQKCLCHFNYTLRNYLLNREDIFRGCFWNITSYWLLDSNSFNIRSQQWNPFLKNTVSFMSYSWMLKAVNSTGVFILDSFILKMSCCKIFHLKSGLRKF